MDLSTATGHNTPVQAQLIDSLPDSGTGVFYGTGTTGPNAAHPNLPFENVGLNALNGDLLTRTGISTPSSGFDNVISFSRQDPTSSSTSSSSGYGQETLMEDDGSTGFPFKEFTLLDNNMKFILDSNSNVSKKNTSGPDSLIGKISDPSILKLLQDAGMSPQGANDLVATGNDGSIFGVSQIKKDYTPNDLQEMDLSQEYAQTQQDAHNAGVGEAATPQTMKYFASIIHSLLNTSS
jgi:hypothetical protein